MTDAVNSSTATGQIVENESRLFKDLFFQNLQGGAEFGKRFLYHLVFALTNYNFNYFIRMDDDYMLCIDRLINEIPMPPRKFYHWGYVHCQQDIVRPEESIILFSRDLIELFLGQNPRDMLCHKFADQMIALWRKLVPVKKLYRHDLRLHHAPPASHIKELFNEDNLCSKFIGLHGTYEEQMRKFWKQRGPSDYPKNATLDDFSSHCKAAENFDWRNFDKLWKARPQLCINRPKWDGVKGETYIGRQGG